MLFSSLYKINLKELKEDLNIKGSIDMNHPLVRKYANIPDGAIKFSDFLNKQNEIYICSGEFYGSHDNEGYSYVQFNRKYEGYTDVKYIKVKVIDDTTIELFIKFEDKVKNELAFISVEHFLSRTKLTKIDDTNYYVKISNKKFKERLLTNSLTRLYMYHKIYYNEE